MSVIDAAVEKAAEALDAVPADPRPTTLVNRDRARAVIEALRAGLMTRSDVRHADTVIGYYRFPPVDPATGKVSAQDDAIFMGQMRHCDVPEPHRKDGCQFLMNAHFWQASGTYLGIVICPDEIVARLAALEQAVARVRELHHCLDNDTECVVCWEDYPCRTLRALDGTETP